MIGAFYLQIRSSSVIARFCAGRIGGTQIKKSKKRNKIFFISTPELKLDECA